MAQSVYNIAFAVNDGYVEPLCVALQSIAAHSRARFKVNVLYTALTEQSKGIIRAVCENTGLLLCFHNVSQHIPNGIATGEYGRYGVESIFRFVLPLVTRAKYVLYLDCDIIATDDITRIFGYKAFIKNRAAAVVEDCTSEVQQERDIRFCDPYFNSGVMLLNLDYWRSQHLTQKAITNAFFEPKLPYRDQDVLNILLDEEMVAYMPKIYNAQNGFYWRNNAYFLRDPVIVHFTGQHKPWKPTCGHPYRDEWLRLYKVTFGYDFKHRRNLFDIIRRLWHKYSPFVKYKEQYITFNY